MSSVVLKQSHDRRPLQNSHRVGAAVLVALTAETASKLDIL